VERNKEGMEVLLRAGTFYITMIIIIII